METRTFIQLVFRLQHHKLDRPVTAELDLRLLQVGFVVDKVTIRQLDTFFFQNFDFPSQHYCTNAPLSSLSYYYPYNKNERTKRGNL